MQCIKHGKRQTINIQQLLPQRFMVKSDKGDNRLTYFLPVIILK